MAKPPPTPEQQRRQILKVLFISLLLDLISFTFILPLFPKLVEFYRDKESYRPQGGISLLSRILLVLNSYKNSFSRQINDRYDVVLLGGALGSMFSFLQAIASPIIGTLSDKYGRRTALLWSMAGNILSVALWVAAVDFRTFIASRVVGGLSEGNVQLALAIATDISSESQRGATMALVGACFSIAFTFGPALGAYLANVSTLAENPFATAAGFSLFLIVTETIYLYLYLPETLPELVNKSNTPVAPVANTNGNGEAKLSQTQIPILPGKPSASSLKPRTNSWLTLNSTHFAFILFFSGMEFSLSFMTYELFGYGSSQNGKLLGFIGLVASILQGGVTRRLHPYRSVQLGAVSAAAAFFMLARLRTQRDLYISAALLAVSSATVVTGLNGLASFESGENERGNKLGKHRSYGQIGRALGPLGFCSLYWWAGREVSYTVGGVGMVAVCTMVFAGLKMPPIVKDSKLSGKRI